MAGWHHGTAEVWSAFLFGLTCLFVVDPYMLALTCRPLTAALFQSVKFALHPDCVLNLLVTGLCV